LVIFSRFGGQADLKISWTEQGRNDSREKRAAACLCCVHSDRIGFWWMVGFCCPKEACD